MFFRFVALSIAGVEELVMRHSKYGRDGVGVCLWCPNCMRSRHSCHGIEAINEDRK